MATSPVFAFSRHALLPPSLRFEPGNASAVPPPSSKSPSSTNLASPHPPPPGTSPPSVPPLDALPSISSGSPGLGSLGQWLVEGTSGSSGPRTSNSSSKPLSTKPAPNTKLSTLSEQVKVANATPADGSSSHHNLSSSGSSSNNAANQGVGIGGYPVSTTITSSYRKNTKPTLLNPMSLLMRRRSSQASGLLSDSAKTRNAKDLPGDFDPGIIYGTRHPDWSNPPKRGQNEAVRPPVNGRSISPLPPVRPLMDPNNKLLKVEVVVDDAGSSGIDDRLAELEKQRTPVFREHFDDGVGQDRGSMGGKVGEAEVTPITPGMPTRAAPEPLRVPTTNPPPIEDSHKPGVVDSEVLPSSTGLTTQISRASSVVSSNEGDLDDGKPRGVTLVDHPLSLLHHLMTNSSRFSFEASSAAESNKDEPEEPYNDYDDDDDRDGDGLSLELDFGGDDDEGFSRANEGLFMMPDEGIYGDSDYIEDEGGVPLALGSDPSRGISIALSKDSPIDVDTPIASLNLMGMAQVLPAMNPEPAAMQPEQPLLVQRLGNQGLNLNSDSDCDEVEQGDGIAGYGDDNADLYFDDGLYQYQKRQQREAEAAAANEINSPGALRDIGGGYESDYAADWGSQSGYYSIDDDEYEPEDADGSMLAEANPEALAYDIEFYTELASRPVIRRPGLTPISERSESSYRNSLGFPVSSSRSLSATVPAGEDIGSLTNSNSGGGEITLEQLMCLRRDSRGGSNGGLRSSRGSGTHSPVPANSSLLAQGAISPPPQMPPPGFAGGGGVGAPPGLSHAGKNAMLPTKTSFEDVGLPPPSEVATTESGSRNGRSTADSSYASAVGSPIGFYDAMDAEDGNENGGREGWGFSPVIAAASSPSM
ncbi:hypothetical protein B9Z19DRAFT_1109641 [Tuber borchii]|uniref:Uncharacterized protein n=1 Tax=Tuber borchii TaxID=42251 RepID=A0A2T6ZKY1_TUBBO|nr:hypothetical protein B9Z19DRAFT_1109641 [Tuber borchii]